MPTQFCSKNDAGEVIWVEDIPSDVIHLSELFEILEEMDSSTDRAPVEIPLDCTREELLEGFEYLRKMKRLYDEINKFNYPPKGISVYELEEIRVRINTQYHEFDWYRTSSSPMYNFITTKKHLLKTIEEYEDKSFPIGNLKSTKLTKWDLNTEFVGSCYNGYFLVMKWLLRNTGGYEMEIRIDAFRQACLSGQEMVSKWLYRETGIASIPQDYTELFGQVCAMGNESIAKWLYYEVGRTHRISVHRRRDYAFRLACGNGHTVIANWLKTLL